MSELNKNNPQNNIEKNKSKKESGGGMKWIDPMYIMDLAAILAYLIILYCLNDCLEEVTEISCLTLFLALVVVGIYKLANMSNEPEPDSESTIPEPAFSLWQKWVMTLFVTVVVFPAMFWLNWEEEEKEEVFVTRNLEMSSPTDSINGHGYVDLGLSVKWADRNVGANSPSDYGSYFAWGETCTKSEYTRENCVTYEKNFDDISGNSRYDAASANWGGSWRMPTQTEMKELKNMCKWVWTTQGGHYGYKVTGPNGNSIFLPAAGYRYGTGLRDAGSYGDYWSATPDSYSYKACYLYFGSGNYDWRNRSRYYGHAVRPVSDGLLSDSEK